VTPSQCRLAVAHGEPVLTVDLLAATAQTGGDAEAMHLLRQQCDQIADARLEGDFEHALRLAIQPNSNPKENR
jgi:hypothetical protein